MNNSGIYSIINKQNGKRYIGSAVNLKRRINEHKNRLNKNKHNNRYLQNAWNKYGKQSFIFEILEYTSKEKLIEIEQWWLDIYKSYIKDRGYNINKKAESSLGIKRTKLQIKNSIIARGAKPFVVYNKKGIIIGTFLNKKECAKKLKLKNSSNITQCLNWKKKTLFGYLFIYKDELHLLKDKLEFVKPESSKPFLMYDDSDNIYGVFINQVECAKKYKLSNKNINAVLNGKKNTHFGFKFEYLE